MRQSSARWWDLLSAIVLVVAMFAAASRITSTKWAEHLQIIYAISFLGAVAGLALGQSTFTARRAVFFAAAYGLFAIGWQLGLTLGEGVEWRERLVSLWGRLAVSVSQLVQQKAVPDQLLPLVLFGVLYWVLGAQAGYAVTRHADPWQATLPGGLAILVIHAYDFRQIEADQNSLIRILGVYFLASLLLLARLGFLRQREQWKRQRVFLSPGVGIDMTQATALAALLLVFIAWAAPAPQIAVPPVRDLWKAVSQPWNNVRTRMGNAFTSLRASFGVVNDTFTDRMSLGRGNSLADSEVMTVETPADPPPGVRFYWRAWTYDMYDSGRWLNTFSRTDSVRPDEFDFDLAEYDERWTGEFVFTPAAPISTLFVAPQPVWVSRPAEITVASGDDGVDDLLSIKSIVVVFTGEVYRSRGSFSKATVAQLRAAGDEYPEWITEHYLQLPAISDRTRRLASDIAAPHDNAYDIAEAVTDYLRKNIQYTEAIPAPPTNQEPIDWFLFDWRQGFCNYYATAEVVMLRSLGIPARLSVGYARGAVQAVPAERLEFGERPDTLIFKVLERDAHAWPEVYFPGYGWVEFEPTTAQTPITRPTGEHLDSSDIEAAPPTPFPEAPDRALPEEDIGLNAPLAAGSRWVVLLLAAVPLAIALLGVFIWRFGARANMPPLPVMMETGLRRFGVRPPPLLRRWALYAALPPIEKAYQEVNGALNRLGARPALAATPSERVAALVESLPDIALPAWKLLAEYHAAAYGRSGGDAAIAREAGRAIVWASWQEFFNRKFSGRRNVEAPRFRNWRA